MSQHIKGLLISFIGMLVLSPLSGRVNKQKPKSFQETTHQALLSHQE